MEKKGAWASCGGWGIGPVPTQPCTGKVVWLGPDLAMQGGRVVTWLRPSSQGLGFWQQGMVAVLTATAPPQPNFSTLGEP